MLFIFYKYNIIYILYYYIYVYGSQVLHEVVH